MISIIIERGWYCFEGRTDRMKGKGMGKVVESRKPTLPDFSHCFSSAFNRKTASTLALLMPYFSDSLATLNPVDTARDEVEDLLEGDPT
jgi:hypothetical protein